ncbi:MAG: hypothetical protein JW818_12465, partial [Pirellulales bacterium]|nr:hypothetical protein [Pirellulales bacterium]
ELREELAAMHRSTLEIRLATEELWAQLAGAAPPAALTRSLGQIREKLAEDYRLANRDLARQRKELVDLRQELSAQYDAVGKQKERLAGWIATREQDIQDQAARLVAREQELDRQETTMRDHATQWQSERLGYQREIRRLRLALQRDPVAAGVDI